MSYVPGKETDMAGMVCYQDESHYFVLGRSVRNGEQVMVLEASCGEKETLATLPCNSKDVALKVVGEGRLYSFYFSDDKMKTWNTVYENADASILSTNRAGGFTGTMIGMYASGQHK